MNSLIFVFICVCFTFSNEKKFLKFFNFFLKLNLTRHTHYDVYDVEFKIFVSFYFFLNLFLLLTFWILNYLYALYCDFRKERKRKCVLFFIIINKDSFFFFAMLLWNVEVVFNNCGTHTKNFSLSPKNI